MASSATPVTPGADAILDIDDPSPHYLHSNESLSQVTSFTHRTVEILGEAVFPFLPKTLEQLLAECEPKEMTGFLILLNQLICKFGSSFYDILEELYPTIADRVFNVIPTDGFLSGPGTNTEGSDMQALK